MTNIRLTPERLSELERDAMSSLRFKSRYTNYILISPIELLSVIAEIRELRKELDPEALVVAYKAGERKGREEK